jgi:hypothetical protein
LGKSTWEQELKDDTGDANATYYPSGDLVLAYSFETNMATVNYKLAWKFEILALSPSIHKTIYVNATTGTVLKSFDMRHSNVSHRATPFFSSSHRLLTFAKN